MSLDRVQEIAGPIDLLLGRYGFELDGAPLEEKSLRMVSFRHPDGKKVDYSLETIVDIDNGPYRSSSELVLSIRLYRDGQSVELYTDGCCGSNMPATQTLMRMLEDVEPKLKEQLEISA